MCLLPDDINLTTLIDPVTNTFISMKFKGLYM